MIKIINNIIPFDGYKLMTLWPFLFVKKKAWEKGHISSVDIQHEEIHACQQGEMFGVGAVVAGVLALCGCGWWSLFALPMFLWWYVGEWFVRSLIYGSGDLGYGSLSFEQEAYYFEDYQGYVGERKPFAWVQFLTKSLFER